MTRRMSRRRLRGAALTGSVVAVYGFLFVPLVVVVGASFDGGPHAFLNFPPHDLSLAWYWKIPARYFAALGVSVALGIVAAVASASLGVLAALALVRSRWHAKGAIAVLFRAPLQLPLLVTGFAFLQLYYLVGAWTGVYLMGTFAGLGVAHAFITFPYVFGTTVAVLQGFNASLEEAALSLGASRWRTFRRVTLPLILPGAFAGALYAFIVSFGDVPVSMFLAGTRYVTFPVEMFFGLELDFDPSILAMSTLILAGSFAVIWLFERAVGLDRLVGASGGS
jgi:putative spermidine/putrescine transport system permease protein